ncbi:MAG: endonuclease domain-containing protein [Candidatus Kuenenbacteria bacterium]
MTILLNKYKQKEKRRHLRNNSTRAERFLWNRLKNKQLGIKFRRQYGIGCYIADFCCPRKRLVIEVDGSIHQEKEAAYYDKERSLNIENLGFKVIRFTNEQVENNIDEVINKIKKIIKTVLFVKMPKLSKLTLCQNP